MDKHRVLRLVAAALLVGACDERNAVGTVTTTDSAGVVIRTSIGPDRLGSRPLTLDYRLGGQPSGPQSFYQLYPRYVSISTAGAIAILNQQAYVASVFESDGTLLRSYGSRGGGPGEFRFPASIGIRPDGEVLVYDFGKRSLVRFSAEGDVLDEASLSIPFTGLGIVGSETGMILLSETRPRGEGVVTKQVLHLSSSDTVPLGPSAESALKSVTYSSCDVSMAQPPLFSSDITWASNGARTAVAAGPEYAVWIFDDTTLVHVVRRDLDPEMATPEVAEREVGEGERWGVAGRECLVPPHEILDQRGYEAVVPVIDALSVAPSGELWVRRRIVGTEVRSLDIFNGDGEYLETITPAPPFPIAFLPDGRLVTIETDSLDVQTVAVYRTEQ